MTLWPSGLRRNVKSIVFNGLGLNLIDVTFVKRIPTYLQTEPRSISLGHTFHVEDLAYITHSEWLGPTQA